MEIIETIYNVKVDEDGFIVYAEIIIKENKNGEYEAFVTLKRNKDDRSKFDKASNFAHAVNRICEKVDELILKHEKDANS